MATTEPMFPNLSGEETVSGPQEIESLCVSCYKVFIVFMKYPEYTVYAGACRLSSYIFVFS